MMAHAEPLMRRSSTANARRLLRATEQIYNGKYYSQNGKVYLCTRDSGQLLAFDLAELVGLYVTEVTE